MSETPSTPPAEADVVVAGSGAAGLTAALAAAVRGARVLLVERGERLGGTTSLGGGRTWVPCNHFPENADDTPEAARAYLKGLFSDEHPEMIEAFIDAAPKMARFVEEHSPHRWVVCPEYPDYHPSAPGGTLGGRVLDITPIDTRALTPLAGSVLTAPGYVPMTHGEWERWRYPGGYDWELLERRGRDGVFTGGPALVAGLLDGVVRAGVTVLTGTRLTGVTRGADGAVTAAELEGPQGTATVATGAVIMATGGYDWNEQLASQLPDSLHATGAPPTNTGDALRIAEGLGARAENLGQGWWMPMLAVPGETLQGRPFYRALVRERGAPRQIIVNSAGRRFADEVQPYNEIGKALHRTDAEGRYVNDPAWMVFDEGFRRTYSLPGVLPGKPLPTWVATGRTPAELAEAIGVDAAGLAETLEQWQRICEAGRDEEFGRGESAYDRYCGDPSMPHPNFAPLDEPPYYAVRILAGTIGTKGGPVTDDNAVVRTADGAPVPGLYAVGNAAAFWTSDGYPAPGATLAVGMAMAYRAAEHATRG